MGLLNPLLLALAAAAAVPLLLHLFQRHQGPRVIFPALRYLLRAEKESARRVRLRQILLMLLRIAAVLLLALAAARPFVRAGGTGHSPTAAVIVLDNSMSTSAVEGEVRVLDELKARALAVLEASGSDDRFWLVRAGQPGEPALAGDAEQTALRVRETEPTAAAADISGALTHAAALLASGAEGRAAEIHLLTDLQATGFAAPAPAAAGAPPVVLWHPGTPAPANRAVASVEVGGGLAPVAGQRATVAAAVTGTGTDEVNVRMSVDDRLVAAATAAPGATAMLALPPRPAGLITGRVEVDADALRADDVRAFVARVLPPPSVAVSGDLPFVADGLEVLAQAGRVRRVGAGADVAFLSAGAGLAQLTTGAAIVLPPTAPVELAAVNRRLADAGIPWRYEAPTAGEARFAPAAGDPLLNALAGARLRQVYPLVAAGTPGAADTVLLRLVDGGAWAVRGQRRSGSIYVLLGSPLTPEATTLPTTAAMLPLLDRLTGAWATAEPPRTDAAPGAEVDLPPAATGVERPDGTRDDVAGSSTYRLGVDPGIYRVLAGDSVLAAWAVSAPAAESDLRRLSADELEDRLPGWSLHINSSSDDWLAAVFRERLGRELWRPLLFAALLVLLVETLIAASGRARRADAGGTRIAEAESP